MSEEIRAKDIVPHKTSFSAGDGFYGDGETSFFMEADKLLKLTAQNALAGNAAPAFVPNSTTTVAGLLYMYNGSLYVAKEVYNGPWNADKFKKSDISTGIVNPKILTLEDLKLDVVRGKNIFNKDAINKKSGAYVAYSNGQVLSVAGTSAYIIPINGGSTISFSIGALNVAAFSVFPDLVDSKIYDILPGYLDGTVSSSSTPWVVPSGAVCIVISVSDGAAGSMQVEIGSTKTQFEPYKGGVEAENVLGLDKLLSEKLNGEYSKNIFNKDTLNKKSGVYVAYVNGQIISLPSWSAYVVEIPEGTSVVSINKSSPQVCAFSSVIDLTTAAGTISGFLGGVTGTSLQGWTLPEGTKCLVVSYADSAVSSLQVEKGSVSTSFVAYQYGLPQENVIGSAIHVGAGYKYTTIQDAVDAAPDGGTVIVHQGIYKEAVDVVSTKKFLRIIGVSKKDCVLSYSSGDYYKPPLEMAKGYVENLTIKATGTTMDEGAIQNAYCVHIDYEEETNSSLRFVNCDFENDIRDCVGIGLRENFTLSFLDCYFVTHNSASAPIYCHEQQANNKVGQRLELVDCSMYNDYMSGHARSVTLQESPAFTGNEMSVLMQRCIMKTKNGYSSEGKALAILKYGSGTGGEGSGGPGYLGSQGWYLDPLSELNNEAICNASEQP